LRDSVWTIPASLAATKGIPFWFLFLPLLRCFRSGGSRSVKEHLTPKSQMRSPIQVSSVLRLHAPTRGGIAACRALLRLSSRAILQTAWHVRANGSVCLAFGETHFVYVVLRVVVVWPMHGVILIPFFGGISSPFTPHRYGGELHLFLMV
jgi:hypothetical protein